MRAVVGMITSGVRMLWVEVENSYVVASTRGKSCKYSPAWVLLLESENRHRNPSVCFAIAVQSPTPPVKGCVHRSDPCSNPKSRWRIHEICSNTPQSQLPGVGSVSEKVAVQEKSP